jgi:hypothetical protein
MPTFSWTDFAWATADYLIAHPWIVGLLGIAGLLYGWQLLMLAITRDIDRMERDAHIEGAFDAAHEELTERTRKGAA